MTDALDMIGLRESYRADNNSNTEIAVEALKAGCDVLTLPTNLPAAFDAVMEAVRRGYIPEADVDRSVRRVLSAKALVGLEEHRMVDLRAIHKLFSDRTPFQFAQHVADLSITLVRSNRKALPLQKVQAPGTSQSDTDHASASGRQPHSRVVVVSLTDSIRSPLGRVFDEEMIARNAETTFFRVYNDSPPSRSSLSSALQLVANADVVVIAAFITHPVGRQAVINGHAVSAVGFTGSGSTVLQEVLRVAASKTIVVAFGSPYIIGSFPDIQTYLCTYSLAPTRNLLK